MRRAFAAPAVALPVAVVLAVAGPASPAAAHDPHGHHPQGHQLTVDNGTQSNAYDREDPQLSFAWKLREGDGPRLWARNRAKATTHCDGCRAVAVSVEVVLASHVEGPVEVTNLARSITDCSHCASTAIAYQFVMIGPGRLSLRPASRTRIERIVAQMRRVALAGGSDATIRRREARLAAQLSAELRRGVVRRDRS